MKSNVAKLGIGFIVRDKIDKNMTVVMRAKCSQFFFMSTFSQMLCNSHIEVTQVKNRLAMHICELMLAFSIRLEIAFKSQYLGVYGGK